MASEEITLGIDIGAHKTALVLFDGKKRIEDRYNPYPPEIHQNYSLFSDWLRADVNDLTYGKNVTKAGISCAGVITGSIVKRSPNLGILEGSNLNDLLKMQIEICAIENDAKAFLVYELECGVANKYKNVLALTIGTGIGGAFSSENGIFRGVRNAAGEVGHMIIEGRSTMEDLASTRFLQKGTSLSPKDLQEAAVSGDKKALKAYEYFGKNLGKGIANLINILDPEFIVLGGGLSHAYPIFIEHLQNELDLHVLLPEARKIPIQPSSDSLYAPALGAAILARRDK